MKTIIVDDELWAIKNFQQQCRDIPYIDIVGTFTDPVEALDYAKENWVDFAVLDIDMPQLNGLELGVELRKLYPDVVIIYVTAHDCFALDAIKLKADYFVVKPYTVDDVNDALSRAMLLSRRQRKPVFIRTFGNFDVFLNGQPVIFSSGKAKELLALMVDRKGGIVTTEEAMAVIWEEQDNSGDRSAVCRTAAMRLRKTLSNYGIDYIISECASGRYVDSDRFDCDYYLYLRGEAEAKQAFTNEYMAQYSWAEFTLATLLEKADQEKNNSQKR